MGRRKLTIALLLPPSMKDIIARKLKTWRELPIKWYASESFVVPLLPLGHVDDTMIDELLNRLGPTVEGREAFDIEFSHIALTPTKEAPKIIHATGPKHTELKKLVEHIERALDLHTPKKKSFAPTIPLGKVRAHAWNPLETPLESISIQFSVSVESIAIVEYAKDRGGTVIIDVLPFS
jgi:2'-5' RNA ligase